MRSNTPGRNNGSNCQNVKRRVNVVGTRRRLHRTTSTEHEARSKGRPRRPLTTPDRRRITLAVRNGRGDCRSNRSQRPHRKDVARRLRPRSSTLRLYLLQDRHRLLKGLLGLKRRSTGREGLTTSLRCPTRGLEAVRRRRMRSNHPGDRSGNTSSRSGLRSTLSPFIHDVHEGSRSVCRARGREE